MDSLKFYSYLIIASPWLLLCFLVDVVSYIMPFLRPAKEWSLNQAVRVRTVRLVLLYWSRSRSGDRCSLKPGREGDRFEIIHPQAPEMYRYPLDDYLICPSLIGATWTPSRLIPGKVTSNTAVVLHFHGGGFVIGDGRDHDTGFLARSLLQHLNCEYICTPQYRLASSKGGEFPAPMQDAVTAYLHLLRDLHVRSTQIILSGDSAGGNIVLGLLRYIKDYGKELNIPAPKAVMLWSPWVDVDAALHQEIRLSPNYRTDYLNAEFGRWGATTISGSGAVDTAGPYLCPLRHPFSLDSCVPMFINAGEREVLCHDINEFSRRYQSQGWPVHLYISEGCPHDVLLLGPRIGFAKEASEAVRRANGFLSQVATLPTQHSQI